MQTCIHCDTVHQPQICYGWIEYKAHNVQRKSVYKRLSHVKLKIRDLFLLENKKEAFLQKWMFLESQFVCKRYPKLNFFINKILESLDIPKQLPCKMSSKLCEKYELIWEPFSSV